MSGGFAIVSNVLQLSKVDENYLRLDGLNKAVADLDIGNNKITNSKDPTTEQDLATKSYVDRGLTLPRKYKVLIVAGQSNTYYGREWGISEAITSVKYMNRRILQFGFGNGQSDVLLPCSLRLDVNESDNVSMAGYGSILAGLIMQDAVGENTLDIIQPDEMLLILPCMLGSTGFSNGYFTPHGTGFTTLIRRIRYILTHFNAEFIGMTWSQGETDAVEYSTPSNVNVRYQYILQYFVQAVRDHIAYNSNPFDPLPIVQAKANKIPFITFQMKPAWVEHNPAAIPVQTALANIGNVVPYTSSISLTGLPESVRIANNDLIHYDSRQQLFLAQQFFNALTVAKTNANANGNYTPVYTAGSTLLLRHAISSTVLFPTPEWVSAFNLNADTPSTSQIYSQMFINWKHKNSNGYYKYRLSYKIDGVWKNILFEQVHLPLMSTTVQNIAQLLSTDTPFGNTSNGQGFSGLNTVLPGQTDAACALDTSGSFWAPVGQSYNFVHNGSTVIPVFDNFIYDASQRFFIVASEVELYAVQD